MSASVHLEAALAQWLPAPVRIRSRRPSIYASSFPIDELDVEDGDGARHALVLKDVAAETLLDDAWKARCGAPPDPAAEPRAYELLARAELGTPSLIGAQRRGQRTWLFLERVRGVRLDQVGDPSAWRAVAHWLARAHGVLTAVAAGGREAVRLRRCAPSAQHAFAGDPTPPDDSSGPTSDHATWPPPWHAPDVAALEAAAHGSRRRRVAALTRPLSAALERAAAMPQTVIHGELYPANVLIGERGRVCVLDWETIARGPALIDLAELTAGRWDDPGEPLAEAYRRALPDPPPAAELLADLDACRLLVAAGRLAAPPEWTPPPEQARDWLADAELIAERVRP